MLNEDVKYKTMYTSLESAIDEISVLILTKQEIREDKKKDLYRKLADVSNLLESETVIAKDLAALLFNFYILVHSDVSISQDKSSLFFLGHLQEYIEKIFGENS
ncbi:ferredoxin-fold anticodon binding domain-containing protein [Paenibacillus forsythiae]|uniref:Ferredoxin-fold anticodon binding domain-containing protein n=1 Tax=Paenibacillus forsythiae TaxID=365616 RepID=A0ABU3H4M2_9BACL|nr:hypothetical protein [Paenibacillus forsythiae]MDT3425770.1 ferredoxin-fold anticodon binding domain-containing protein [Paenibacillus forsythiae]